MRDPSSALLRRLERGALIWTGLALVATLIAAPSRTDLLLGVAGGGLLSIASFYAIRASVDGVMLMAGRQEPSAPGDASDARDGASAGSDLEAAGARPGLGGLIVKLTGRYALLGLLAYVMIARLRLHPLGLLVGVTALPAAATAEAVRGLGRRVGGNRAS